MARKKKAVRKAAPKKKTRSVSTSTPTVSAVAKLATHPENLLATFNAHAALLEMVIANLHVLAVGGPGLAAMRAAKETARRLNNVRVTDILRRPAGRSRAEYDVVLQLAKIEFRNIMTGVIDRLGRQIRGKL